MARPMFREIPPEPDVPPSQRGEGMLSLRYEDVIQDGRVKLEPITHAVGAAVWRRVLLEHPLAKRLEGQNVLPILSRLQIEGGPGPVGVRGSVTCRGTFEWLRCVDASGRVRLRMDTWADVTGARGRTHGAPPDGAGEPVVLGRMLAEHVLTRPFAAPEERHVTEIPGGLPDGIALREAAWSPPSQALDLPPDAEPIDEGFVLDPCPFVVGLGHTDSNQHVNSLVYPRLLEEAALRRLDALGLNRALYARYVDLGYRKPSFAGDRLRILVRAFRRGGELGVLGAFVADEDANLPGAPATARARCFARMQLVP